MTAPQSRMTAAKTNRRRLALFLASGCITSCLPPVHSQLAVALGIEAHYLSRGGNRQFTPFGENFQIFLARQARFDHVEFALLVDEALLLLFEGFQLIPREDIGNA